MKDNPEEKLINEIKEKYKNTYANVIYHLVNTIDNQKLRINNLENGLQEIRKYIENSNAPQNIKESHLYEMTIKLSYPEGF